MGEILKNQSDQAAKQCHFPKGKIKVDDLGDGEHCGLIINGIDGDFYYVGTCNSTKKVLNLMSLACASRSQR